MTDEKLYKNLSYLISKYILDSSKKNKLLDEIKNRGFSGVKGVLHEISSSKIDIDNKDTQLIKDIAFYFA
ncbi:hypothetical protein A1OK_09690 [Enterovibrio norvegicus FF-454]|uniref:Uncharacterized protein n=1 Tax=Enterovibrio norvegicus FF-454 TaxID=1185651 RepID=A0A1E5C824_9GAMM|nr:hypothetical protein [Enterovibrio norvegicus]OEE61619.1 hypothetical protein A1OK_09690 [Enterovibrio norvegicus FF-454]